MQDTDFFNNQPAREIDRKPLEALVALGRNVSPTQEPTNGAIGLTGKQKLGWTAAIATVLAYIGIIVWYDYRTHDHRGPNRIGSMNFPVVPQ